MAEITKQALKVQNNTEFPNNNNGAITPTKLRGFNVDMIDSLVDEISYNVDSASWNQQIDSLENFTASLATDFVTTSSFNSFTQSVNSTTASLVGSASLALVTASFNNGTRNLLFTKGDTTTFSVNIPDVSGSAGDFVTTASFNSFTQSTDSSLSQLNQSTASQGISIDALNINSGSVNISITNLNLTTASLNTATASLNTSASLALYTASFNTGTRNLTFTKGDTTTFAVNIPDISGSTINTASFATTGSNTFIGNQIISGNILPQNNNEGKIGDDTYKWNQINVNGNGNFGQISAPNRNSMGTIRFQNQQNEFPLSFLEAREVLGLGSGVNTHMYYGTGSNGDALREFVYAQSGSDADFTSVSASFNTRINNITGSGGSTDTGSLLVTASVSLNTITFTKGNGSTFGITVSTGSLPTGVVSGSAQITGFGFVSSSFTESVVTALVTNSGASYYIIDGIDKPKLSFAPGITYRFDLSGIVGSHPFRFSTSPNGPTEYYTGVTSGSGFIQIETGYNTATPLYYYCTNHSGMGNEINSLRIESLQTTASFNLYTGSTNTATQSLFSSASLGLTTASVSLNTITFTKGDNTTFALTVNTGSGGGGGGAAFPFTGSAEITGSLQVTGSVRGAVIVLTVASSTASVNFDSGNMFTLTLPSASTHINPTNIKAGQTVNIQITQPTPGTGSVTFPSNVKFAGGNDYEATTTGSAIDMLTLVSYDGTNVLGTSIKNFL